ncbi:MAG: hypothetical protein BWK72_08090 [Rhodoferax ferrireducens]|uniref:Glycosyltransferase subfamily 4-like N-terminal domain-containing protein n=2 Tax=Pseudomonadota TaxID=1224 RepID=A0A1Y1R007_9GAMM|nr:MAG: hypothetical protein BWK72_08090 [Rhodoferax ferrireducens]OQX17440.1 MAG: hypothetical protein BWK73_01880 [Thiothrix lacustris]
MIIGHIDGGTNPNSVNGVNYVVWSLAEAQAAKDHTVYIIVFGTPSASDVTYATRRGISFLEIRGTLAFLSWIFGLNNSPLFDIVHFHSVFLPKQYLVSLFLKQARSFVITPHGLSWVLLKKNSLRKLIYIKLFDKVHFRRAGAVCSLNSEESLVLTNIFKVSPESIKPVFNPVVSHSGYLPRSSSEKPFRVAYLGRLDPFIKGIDMLLDIASRLPHVSFEIYSNDRRSSLDGLIIPENVFFFPAVYGEDKFEVLSKVTLYIQTSRHEGFPISILEAMKAEVPVAITEAMQISEIVNERKIGLVMPFDAIKASALLDQYMHDPVKMSQHVSQAKHFANENCNPANVATVHLDIYTQVLKSLDSRSTAV